MNGAAVNNGYPRLMLQRSTNQMVLLVSYLMHARNLKWTEFVETILDSVLPDSFPVLY